MELIGYFTAVLIGISPGLIGGGGSILAVPVLVYLMGIELVTATAYSLFIVGTTSLVGVFPKYKKDLVSLKTAIIFGIPFILAVYATRRFLVPAIPHTVFSLFEFVVTKSVLLMLLFAILIAAKSLIGFTGDMKNFPVNWILLLTFTAIAVAGIIIGNLLSNKIDGEKLKKSFGWFVLLMGIYIIIKELFLD